MNIRKKYPYLLLLSLLAVGGVVAYYNIKHQGLKTSEVSQVGPSIENRQADVISDKIKQDAASKGDVAGVSNELKKSLDSATWVEPSEKDIEWLKENAAAIQGEELTKIEQKASDISGLTNSVPKLYDKLINSFGLEKEKSSELIKALIERDYNVNVALRRYNNRNIQLKIDIGGGATMSVGVLGDRTGIYEDILKVTQQEDYKISELLTEQQYADYKFFQDTLKIQSTIVNPMQRELAKQSNPSLTNSKIHDLLSIIYMIAPDYGFSLDPIRERVVGSVYNILNENELKTLSNKLEEIDQRNRLIKMYISDHPASF